MTEEPNTVTAHELRRYANDLRQLANRKDCGQAAAQSYNATAELMTRIFSSRCVYTTSRTLWRHDEPTMT